MTNLGNVLAPWLPDASPALADLHEPAEVGQLADEPVRGYEQRRAEPYQSEGPNGHGRSSSHRRPAPSV